MPEKYRRPHSHERPQAVARMQRDWAAQKAALVIVRRFNAANGYAWFWPKISAALVSKHHWLIIVWDACDTVEGARDYSALAIRACRRVAYQTRRLARAFQRCGGSREQ